jgi:hypothetical protein
MTTTEVTYCYRWNSRRASPGTPISEEEARERDATGEEYTAIVPRPGHPYPVLVTVVWKNSFCSTSFLDDFGRRCAKYSFTKVEGRLFLSEIHLHEYPDDTPGLKLSAATRIEHMVFRTDGHVRRVTTDHGKHEKITNDYSDVSMDANWEPIPEFGDWDSIARFERGGASA